MKSRAILLLYMTFQGFALASPRVSPRTRQREPSLPLPTQITSSPSSKSSHFDALWKRQITTEVSTCGFGNGDPTKPRTAGPGDDCRVDTLNGLWGFCPTTVISATDCGLAGACVDGSDCAGGCGILGVSTITTFTCNQPGNDFCNTELLIDGPDQTYMYIDCAANSGTGILFAEPTLTSAEASSTTPSIASTSKTSTKSSTDISSASSSKSSSSSSAPSSSPGSFSLSSQLSSSASSSTPSVSPAAASNTNASRSGPKSDIGAIVGGVLGGLALIGFFVLAAIFLMRKYQRNQASSAAISQESVQELRRDDPKVVAYGYSEQSGWNHRKNGGYGPSELSTRLEPAELGS